MLARSSKVMLELGKAQFYDEVAIAKGEGMSSMLDGFMDLLEIERSKRNG